MSDGLFGVILADPPWSYKTWTAKGGHKSASAHYATQGEEWISSLPVSSIAADDCALFLWATWPNLPEAMRVIESWGFTYKTCGFSWMKTYKNAGTPVMGLGYWTRANTEPCLLATRGKPQRIDKGVSQVVIETPGPHSAKPRCVHDRIEKLVGGPYCELFGRELRSGWTVLGNEIDGLEMTDALRKVATSCKEPHGRSLASTPEFMGPCPYSMTA